ncbi:MAG: methylated-DNA--[protein]-cysteine S-methyltransferase [Caldithrix sp.]|nr:methylated-DNA--[protein]-cysteine S-methyltransferase [Caldithrix sp.]
MQYEDFLDTPLGSIRIEANQDAITGIHFAREKGQSKSNKWVRKAKQQLNDYFESHRQAFDLPLQPQGTDFQLKVWESLRNVPFGQTISYGGLAERIGRQNAARAVGMANNRNPISIIIPCHRVIGSNGDLIGYGGGTWRKEWLLKHEGVLI